MKKLFTRVLPAIAVLGVSGLYILQAMNTDENNIKADEFSNAVTECDLEKVKAFIDDGFDVNTEHYDIVNGKRWYDGNAIFFAIYAEDKENREAMVRMLVDAGADMDVREDEGAIPLIAIIFQEFSEGTIRHMLQRKPDLEVGDIEGATPLMWTVFTHRPEITKLLIEAGAKLETCDQYGRTALICSADHAVPEVMRVLLEAGADPSAKDGDGKTALDFLDDGEALYDENVQECKRLLQEAMEKRSKP